MALNEKLFARTAVLTEELEAEAPQQEPKSEVAAKVIAAKKGVKALKTEIVEKIAKEEPVKAAKEEAQKITATYDPATMDIKTFIEEILKKAQVAQDDIPNLDCSSGICVLPEGDIPVVDC